MNTCATCGVTSDYENAWYDYETCSNCQEDVDLQEAEGWEVAA